MRKTVLIALLVSACSGEPAGGNPEAVPVLRFEMALNPDPFNTAWNAAKENPQAGVAYSFPVNSDDIAAGSEVRLYAARSTTDSTPLATADDVILADEHVLATTLIGEDGRAEFPHLTVATGNWTSGSNSIPSEFLCGTTLIAARAFQKGDGGLSGYRFLAATWFMAVTAACN